ncbi:VPS28 protein-domain-containing protein [Massariosphaeria phaeospora]|uniref:VPS28 protein-domain-containing protein n=1 Tax=Massariosphaeria phaeospora TaxID=100035 RepID=A0A7C8M5C5_9PLEO|nr:VPS28 protein-domain-containing protein [Massariosphaeria phaeospora]
MYGNRQLAYAPTPYIPRSALSATINLDEEVKLSTNSAERDLYDSLAEIYSIVVTLDALEKAYLKDSVREGDYTETCSRLLKQYKSNLADETVARAFGDLESFKREWDMECPRATERLRVGIPATVEQGPSHKPSQQGESADATLVVNATENFITLLDAIRIGLIEKDTLHPLLVEIIQSANKVTDTDFESKGKIVQWLITLNQMRAAEKLGDDQAREFQFDMEQAYYGFKATCINPEGVARYLTSIVSNSLHWIEDDEAKEEIWNQASARLSGRSGRSAMSAMSRRFRIPSTDSSFELIIHEPALTGDDLGLKTWAASYLLAKRLHTFDFEIPSGYEKPQVLELGAGTGLVGLAMAGLGADVVLTDLFSIYPNLAHNARSNAELIQQNTGSTRTGVLDWTNPTSCQIFSPQSTDAAADAVNLSAKFSLILAADSLYSPEHPRLLVDTIEAWLSEDNDARVVIEFPYRDAYLPEIKDFRSRMEKVGLCVVDEGEEKGYDDWGWSGEDEDRDEGGLVTCWWACWAKIAHRPE